MALRVVASSGALPATVVTPSSSISGRARASAIARASSCPGSQSRITGIGRGMARIIRGRDPATAARERRSGVAVLLTHGPVAGVRVGR